MLEFCGLVKAGKFKSNEYPVFAAIAKQAPHPVLFDSFAHSNSIAVWYAFDTILLLKPKEDLEAVQPYVTAKFKDLFSNFDPAQDTQLHAIVFRAACILMEDPECREIAN